MALALGMTRFQVLKRKLPQAVMRVPLWHSATWVSLFKDTPSCR
jgi:ABC-type amino acid transport system permease subunit